MNQTLHRTASFTTLMLIACWVVFLIDLVLPKGPSGLGPLAEAGVLYPPLVLHGQVWRLLTSGFVHFGFLHILFNSYALFQAGALVEYVYGSPRYAVIYLASLLGGSVAAYLTTIGTQTITAGASGAIMGVFGAMVVLGFKLPPLRRELVQSAALPILLTLGYGFMNPGISNAGHIGGVVTGMLVAALMRPARGKLILDALGVPRDQLDDFGQRI